MPRAKRIQTFSFELTPALRVQLGVAAAQQGISSGQLVRDAVDSYLEQLEQQVLTAA